MWRISERRKQLGLSQEDLASRIGTDQGQISQYENGKGNPTARTLVALADVLDTSIDWLLGRTDDPSRNVNHLSENERAAIEAWRRGDRLEAAKVILNG